MTRGRLAFFCLALGVVASQAGHLVAYQLRFGAAAQQLQSAGPHSYFPAVAKTALGLGAGALLAGLVFVGVARMLAGRRLEGDAAPSYLRLVAVLFSIQLACFVVQETLETAYGAPATAPVLVLLWGTAGQLPVALLGALAVRWLAVRVGPAVARLAVRPELAVRIVPATAPLVWAPAPQPAAIPRPLAAAFNRRGPPFAR